MKIRHYTLLLLLLAVQAASAQNQWAWMSGDKSAYVNGNYGTQGVASPTNTPGSRIGASSWTDAQGNLWLFGGRGNSEGLFTGYLNDLWKYTPSNGQWTWIGGDKERNKHGEYGDKGVTSPSNQPGARQNAVSWVDNEGRFWLFGGSGYASEDEGLLNDLWMYSPAANQWTWVSGTDREDRKGEYGDRDDPSTSNYPGGRSMATGWKDADGNLWLFGGRGYSSKSDVDDLNDVWQFSPAAGTWTWKHGDKSDRARAHYGDKGVFADNNTPGGRQGATGWTGSDGNFWLFGGGSGIDAYSDLWKYDRTGNRWAWINGSKQPNDQPQFTEQGSPDPDGNPGARMLAVGSTDSDGNLWLFGGSGYGGLLGSNALNSLWRYTVNADEWTFVKGETSILPTAVYGSQGVAADDNQPGGMSNSTGWRDQQGNFWVFGGQSLLGYLNQTWKFSISCGAGILGTISPKSASICAAGSQVLTATGGTSYKWQRNGVTIPGQSGNTITATQPGTYTVIITKNNCSAPASNSSVITLVTAPTGTISPATASICEGGSQVLTANGGTSYEWKRDGVTIAGQSAATLTVTEGGTYSVIITNGTCSGPASNTSAITKLATPAGNISPAAASICEGGSQVLTTSGGTSYEWMRDGTPIEGETSATLTATTPGTYSVIIKNGECTGQASNTSVISLSNTAGTRYADVIVSPNEPAKLSARELGVAYAWTPSTGLDNPFSATPTVTTISDRQYVVSITTAHGCPVIDTVMVKIKTNTNNKVFVPTAFTPNGNNVNDRLRPLGSISTIDYFRVYNRWGNLVFETNQAREGWDGTYKGVIQPSDTYTWLLSGKTADGQPVKQSGKTLLIR